MHLTIELPDALGEKLLKYPNMQSVIQQAIEARLMAEQESIPPITKSLIGIMAGSGLDESDYKRYLEEKYL
jgi:hypothetical protein